MIVGDCGGATTQNTETKEEAGFHVRDCTTNIADPGMHWYCPISSIQSRGPALKKALMKADPFLPDLC
jgi:hypothetical protein